MTETELLFSELLNCNRLALYLHKDSSLEKAQSHLISSALKRRALGEPLQYILGRQEFMGLEFKVNKYVLIPRPETEILVETVLNTVRCLMLDVKCLNILDIGTGSGCIAISLAKFILSVIIIATDISPLVLKVAEENSRLNRTEDKINFIQADIFSIKHNTLNIKQFDIIVSNPPYIPSDEIDNLQMEIRYEPKIALDGGKDGLDFYRRIVCQAPLYLKENGFLIMEMGFGQAEMIKNILKNSGNFEIIDIVRDYNDIDRVIVAKNINLNFEILNTG